MSTRAIPGAATTGAGETAAVRRRPGLLDDERRRLAYALHDGLTQVVTAAVLELEWSARRVERQQSDAPEVLQRAAANLREALEEIRGVLSVLDPDTGSEEPGLERLIEELTGRWQIRITWSIEGDLGGLPRSVSDVAAAVIREGVANAAKHGAPTEVHVSVLVGKRKLTIRVRDDGVGFAPPAVSAGPGHLGFAMLRRRVAALGGETEVRSEPGRGTTLLARLPLQERTAPS